MHHEIERMEAGDLVAIDTRRPRGAQMPVPLTHRGGRERCAQPRQVLRLPGDHRHIKEVAFIAAARPGKTPELNAHRVRR